MKYMNLNSDLIYIYICDFEQFDYALTLIPSEWR